MAPIFESKPMNTKAPRIDTAPSISRLVLPRIFTVELYRPFTTGVMFGMGLIIAPAVLTGLILLPLVVAAITSGFVNAAFPDVFGPL